MDTETWIWIIVIGAFVGWKFIAFILRSASIIPPIQSYTKGRFYWAYGLALLGLFAVAEFWGWGLLDSDKVKNVPKNVRENPGVYRSHFEVTVGLMEANKMSEYIKIPQLVAVMVYTVIGLIFLLGTFVFVDKVTPYNLWKEICEEKNTALAILLGAVSIGISLIIAASIHG